MDRTYKMEIGEWSGVNRNLRQHGLPPVDLIDPGKAGNASDIVLLSSEATKLLRQTLTTLIRDCDRRQELIQELIVTNNQLREEVKSQTSVSEKYELKTRDLKSMLDDSKFRMQELEDDKMNSTTCTFTVEDEERLRNTKDAASLRCTQLTQKCETYQQEVERLQKKLKHINIEEENRRKRQHEVMQQLRKKWAKSGSTNDHMLTVIDFYENQMTQLKQEVSLAQSDINGSVHSSDYHGNSKHGIGSTQIEGASGYYKALIKSYEKQLRDSKKKMKDLENERELMNLEMESRPALKDYRDAQAHIKKLERVLKRHGVCPTHSENPKANKLFSTQVEDLEFLPAVQCRGFLKAACAELNVTDTAELLPIVRELGKCQDALPHLQQFATSVLNLVNKSCGQSEKSKCHAVWCDKSWHHVLPTLEQWHMQVEANKELQESIHRLASMLFPWKELHHYDNPTTTQMIDIMDGLASDSEENSNRGSLKEQPRNRPALKEQPTREMLQGIVEHFQNLFDVQRVQGVYTRMNDVYTKLGEVHNVMKTLKDLLGLAPDCRTSLVIDAVARMSEFYQDTSKQGLRDALHTDDLDSVVQKLEEHEEFFPVFQELLKKLMETLNVRRIDQVLPAVKALKLLAGS